MTGMMAPKVVLPMAIDVAALSGLKDLFDSNVTVIGGNYARFPPLSTADLRQALDLDGDVRQVRKMRQTPPIVGRLALR